MGKILLQRHALIFPSNQPIKNSKAMEDPTILISSISALLLILLLSLKFLFFSKKRYQNLPPSPPSLPIIGHVHLIRPPAHRALRNLSQKYGPIISVRFVSRFAVVVSSASAAEECFTKNDVVLANRPESLNGKYIAYNHTMLAAASYGDHWRNLRRITSVEVLSNSRLNKFLEIRKDEVKRLLLKLAQKSGDDDFAKIEMKSMLVDLTFNNIMRMVAGKRYYGDNVVEYQEANRFKELIAELTRSSGVGAAAEFLPMLKWISNYENKVKNLAKKMDNFLQGLVDEHRHYKGGNTMIDHLLSLQESEPEYYSDQIIKGLVLIMIIAGTDTSAVTLEWTMSSLLNHPEVLSKAREEIDAQVGDQDRLIEESDMANLHYLQSVMWETLRLYPAAPLLLRHVASEDCTVGGYDVPRGTMVLVNAYAIHRDPKLWNDAEAFKPERFEKEERSGSSKLMPFGLGRRACPGAGLAQRIVSLTLGSMIQCFEWRRESEEKIDLSEGGGTTMPKVQPLVAMCKARPIIDKVLRESVE